MNTCANINLTAALAAEPPTGSVDASVFALLETSYSLITPASVATAKKQPQRDRRIGFPSASVNARALLNPPCQSNANQSL